MSLPNTLAIMQQIETMITGLGLYTTVVLEAQRDWTDAYPICVIQFEDDKSEHWASGGTIKDTQGFRVASAVSFTRQTPMQAITQLCSLRDAVIPLFQQHAYLTGIAGVGDSRVRPNTNRIGFAKFGNDTYLIHEMIVEVESVWSVPIGVNGI